MTIITSNPEERASWVLAIYSTLCESVDEKQRQRVFAWQHQRLLGTGERKIMRGPLKLTFLVFSCIVLY
jgi:hypothetical protein